MTRSCSSLDDVRITTGMRCVRGSAFRRRSTSRPSTFGSFRSSRISVGFSPSPSSTSSACWPSRATTISFMMVLFLSARSVRASWSGLSSTSRIFFIAPVSEGEREGRALLDGALGPDPSSVALDDTRDRREADPRSLELVGAVQPLEGAEELVRVRHLEAGAVVPHEEVGRVPVGAAELDPRRAVLARELPGIPEQVLEDHAQEARVSGRPQSLRDHDLHVAAAAAHPELLGNRPSDPRQVDVLPLQLAPRHVCERQHVVDELTHPLRRGAHAAEVVERLRLEDVSVVLDERLREAVDALERRPQVVRHGVAERRELTVRGLELRGALRDTALQPLVQRADLTLDALPLGDVAEDAAEERPVLATPRGQRELHQELPAVLPKPRELDRPPDDAGLLRGDEAREARAVRRAEPFRHQDRQLPTEDLLLAPAED